MSAALEWLETNGIGGFSSGTVSGINSRRYHGLLVAASKPPVARVVLVSKFEETLVVAGRRFDLSANRYPGEFFPKGFLHLDSFRLDPFPVWEYEIDGIRLERSLFMPHGRNATFVRWRLLDSADARLEVRPLLAFRDFHHLGGKAGTLDRRDDPYGCVRIGAAGDELPDIFLSHNGSSFAETGEWYRNFEYEAEAERGFDCHEDLFQPFVLGFGLDDTATVATGTEPVDWREASVLAAAERERRQTLLETAGALDATEEALILAADQFIVSRGSGRTVIAGYPWFSDWGRDTMIGLPGLTLSTNRPEIAKDILEEFAGHVSEGMIPNRFPDEGEAPDYNTADATLWFFEAVRAYLATTGDIGFVEGRIFDILSEIVSHHMRGTRHGIRVDTDGLLHAGEAGTQLTWMDAKHGEESFTPRVGKPVEIQALWYNALRTMEELAERLGRTDTAAKYRNAAVTAKLSFGGTFWNEEDECLFDVVEDSFRDRTLRPNQILSVSLHHAIVDDPSRMRKIVSCVERSMLTPFGLRSLSQTDPRYRGTYEGGPRERDSRYHQGTVWAWLIGPFIDALAKAFPERKGEVPALLAALRGHLHEAGIGQVSEIFDGDAPHRPRGCPAQAWSVAELLRVLRKYPSNP